MLVVPMFAFRWSSCGRKPEYSEVTHPSDHMIISHADAGYWTRVAAVIGERVTLTPARQQYLFTEWKHVLMYKSVHAERWVST